MSKILHNYLSIQSRIQEASARAVNGSKEVELVAVSKKQPIEKVNELLSQAPGEVILGENYVQEYVEKKPALLSNHKAHFIGALQSNKAALAVEHFDAIHSVDSEKLAYKINSACLKLNKAVDVYLQVNISCDPAKSGFARERVLPFVQSELSQLTGFRFAGLMTITQLYEAAEDARADFAAMRELRDELQSLSQWKSQPLGLSMGMSADFEVAVEEGATIVRVGSSIFGPRS